MDEIKLANIFEGAGHQYDSTPVTPNGEGRNPVIRPIGEELEDGIKVMPGHKLIAAGHIAISGYADLY